MLTETRRGPRSDFPAGLFPCKFPDHLSVDSFSQVVMKNPLAPRVRCSQRDSSLPFKLAVVGAVGRGEQSHKQAQRRYGIRGRGMVLTRCRRCATHFVAFRAGRPIFPSAPNAISQNLEQRIKQLEPELREQKQLTAKQLRDTRELNLLLHTMLQLEEDHGIPLPKKSFRRPLPGWLPLGNTKAHPRGMSFINYCLRLGRLESAPNWLTSLPGGASRAPGPEYSWA